MSTNIHQPNPMAAAGSAALEAFSFRVFSSLSSTLKPCSRRAMAFRNAKERYLGGGGGGGPWIPRPKGGTVRPGSDSLMLAEGEMNQKGG